jgi:alanine-glyoxylate transaminase/(R)-3-amino-2-methylpropionate-pyruvate transaminase
MARVYTKNNDILALRNSYHGASYGAQSLTGVGNFRHNTPLLGGIVHVAQPDGYRGIFGDNMPAYLDEIDRNIHYATSKQLAGMIVEPIQGYGGIVPLLPGYIKGAYERVHAAGGIFIVDEVQSGFCRTGDNYWGFESEDIIPDIVVVAKGMGNGYPLGGVIAKRQIAEVLKDKFYFNTYGANPTSCAAGRAVLQVLKEEKLQENARRVGAALKKRLLELQEKYPIIGDVRGKGLMLSLELVKDRQTKEPAVEEAANIIEMTRHQGLVISKSGGYKNCLRLMPPLCLSIEDIDYIISALDNCFSSNQLK